MRKPTKRPAARRPGVYITAADHQRLSTLAGGSSPTSPGAALLREKLERAVVLGPGEPPGLVVRLDSIVRYQDRRSGIVRTVQVVLPEGADIDENRISVFTPVGAALLGIPIGEVFAWETDGGEGRSVTIVEVENRHETV